MTITRSPVDLYDMLGVASTATTEEITSAFRSRAKELHPDRATSDAVAAERFKTLSHAYSVLVRPERRAVYDRQRSAVTHPSVPARGPTHEPLFRTPSRARAAIASGIGLMVLGVLGGITLASVPTGDSGKTVTLWLVVVKLIVCGAILWVTGWWRLRRLQRAGSNEHGPVT